MSKRSAPGHSPTDKGSGDLFTVFNTEDRILELKARIQKAFSSASKRDKGEHMKAQPGRNVGDVLRTSMRPEQPAFAFLSDEVPFKFTRVLMFCGVGDVHASDWFSLLLLKLEHWELKFDPSDFAARQEFFKHSISSFHDIHKIISVTTILTVLGTMIRRSF